MTTVLVDNTNIRKKEMAPYVELAKEYGYYLELLEPKTPWRNDINQLLARNQHGLDREKLKSQKERWEKWTASDLWKSVTFNDKNNNNTKPVLPTRSNNEPETSDTKTAISKNKNLATPKSYILTDEQIRNLPSNVDKLDALIIQYNLGCKMNHNGEFKIF